MGEFYGNQHVEPDRDSYEELVENIRALAAELGEAPTTEDAANDDRFPALSTIYRIIEDSWSQALLDAGIEPASDQVSPYDEDDRREILEDIRRAAAETEGDTLTTRGYDEIGEFWSGSIKSHFGSWSTACALADVVPGSKYGEQCTGPRGNALDSYHELRAARVLHDQNVSYEAHPPVDGSDWIADFYIPCEDLWIEIDGFRDGQRPNERSFANKLAYYAENDMQHLVIGSDESIPVVLDEHIANVDSASLDVNPTC
ncbi:hypothetical protein JCM17823_16760 [Halorubrum gandharaense]